MSVHDNGIEEVVGSIPSGSTTLTISLKYKEKSGGCEPLSPVYCVPRGRKKWMSPLRPTHFPCGVHLCDHLRVPFGRHSEVLRAQRDSHFAFANDHP
jgi:hypothetical protein